MLQTLDTQLFRALNAGAANPVLDWVMPRITSLHHHQWFLVLLALVALVTLVRGTPRGRAWVLCTLAAVALGDITGAKLVKALIPRDRPCHVVEGAQHMAVPGARVLGDCPGSRSFPSNHAANMMAVAVVAWRFSRGRYRWLWFLLPLVVAYSRVYLGYHYPFDLAGGWLLGLLAAALCLRVARRWLPAPAEPDPLAGGAVTRGPPPD